MPGGVSPAELFAVWVWLGGGGGAIRVPWRCPCAARGSGRCLGPKEREEEKGGSASCLPRRLLSRGCWDLVSGGTVSPLPSPLGAERSGLLTVWDLEAASLEQ